MHTTSSVLSCQDQTSLCAITYSIALLLSQSVLHWLVQRQRIKGQGTGVWIGWIYPRALPCQIMLYLTAFAEGPLRSQEGNASDLRKSTCILKASFVKEVVEFTAIHHSPVDVLLPWR